MPERGISVSSSSGESKSGGEVERQHAFFNNAVDGEARKSVAADHFYLWQKMDAFLEAKIRSKQKSRQANTTTFCVKCMTGALP